MLRKIREQTGSLVVKIILGLLIISFGAWGIGDMVTFQAQDATVAEVDGNEITRIQVENEVRREIARLNPQFGNRLTPETARLLGMPQSVLGRMVTDALLTGEAAGLKIAISDETVRAEVQGNPSFQSSLGAGQFDRERLQNLLYQFGMSEREYLERVRSDVARSVLIDSVEQGLTPPRVLNDAVFKFREEKRIAEIMFIGDGTATVVNAATDVELREYHTSNPNVFTAPELREITLVVLKSDDLVDEDGISDADIEKAFNERASNLGAQEKRDLSQMFLGDRVTADKARAEVMEGKEFVDVAKRLAGMDEEGVNLGLATRSEVIAEIANAAFSLAEGSVTEPVPGPGGIGFYLVKVNKVEAAKEATLDESRADLRKTLARDKAVDTLYTLVNNIEDELGKGATLEEAANALSLKTVKIPDIDRNGNGGDGMPLVDLPIPAGTVAQTAFDTDLDADSTLQDTGNDVFYVLRVDKVKEPALRPFENVRAAVKDAVDAERRRDITLSLARDAAERVKAGETPESIAADLGGTVSVTSSLKRHYSSRAAGIPQPLLQDIFKLERDAAGVTRADGGYYVSRLKEIIPADPIADKDGRDAVEEEMAVVMRNDLVTQLAAALRREKGVTVNQDILSQVLDPTAVAMANHPGQGY